MRYLGIRRTVQKINYIKKVFICTNAWVKSKTNFRNLRLVNVNSCTWRKWLLELLERIETANLSFQIVQNLLNRFIFSQTVTLTFLITSSTLYQS